MALKLHHRLFQRGFLMWSRLTRGMTLGVRAVLIEGDRVVLVKHTYVPGWHFPGGGVEAGESVSEALAREVWEEANAVLTGPAELFGIYRNAHADSRDHVALFVCRAWERRPAPASPNHEIAAAELFPLARLPADASPGTAARMRELLSGAPPAVDW